VSAYFYNHPNKKAAPKWNLDYQTHLWLAPQHLYVPQVVKALSKGFVDNNLDNDRRGHDLLQISFLLVDKSVDIIK
jgi:hypothetical protein